MEDSAMITRVAKAINGPHHPAPDLDKLRDIRWNMLNKHEQIFTMNIARAVLREIAPPENATVLTISVKPDGSTSFHSSIPSGQSWLETRASMEFGMKEFQRQFDESDLCPVKRKGDR